MENVQCIVFFVFITTKFDALFDFCIIWKWSEKEITGRWDENRRGGGQIDSGKHATSIATQPPPQPIRTATAATTPGSDYTHYAISHWKEIHAICFTLLCSDPFCFAHWMQRTKMDRICYFIWFLKRALCIVLDLIYISKAMSGSWIRFHCSFTFTFFIYVSFNLFVVVAAVVVVLFHIHINTLFAQPFIQQ